MSRLHLVLAISQYDHVRDVCSGAVSVEGADLTHLNLSVEKRCRAPSASNLESRRMPKV